MRLGWQALSRTAGRAFAITLLTTLGASVLPPTTACAANAPTTPALTASRTCVRLGTKVRLSIRSVPASTTVRYLVTDRLSGGTWRRRSVSRIATSAASMYVKPGRGRWRFAVRSVGVSATVDSPKVELAVVGPKVVALTFDGGPWPRYTRSILAILRQRDVRATFFMVGAHLKLNPAVGRSVVGAGHEVGNHTYSHPRLTNVSTSGIKREIDSTQALIKKTLNARPRWFRPPYGSTDSRVRAVCRTREIRHVLWDADTADWLLKTPDAIMRRVMRGVKPNAVILMHDGGGNRSLTVKTLPRLIARLKAQGYDFVTMSELAELKRYE